MTDAILSAALIAYVGVAGKLDSVSAEPRVVERIGEPAALDVLPRVRAILDELYSVDALRRGAAEAELGQGASEWLHINHPDLSADAVTAIANNFAYDWR